MSQTGWVAVAVSPEDSPGTGGTTVAGLGRRHAVEGQRWQRPGRGPATCAARPARPQAAPRPASSGEAPSHARASAGLALGPRVPDHRPPLPPALAVGAGALARPPRMRGAVARVVA